ncbi:MAG: hypothetical protein CMK71_02100 [Pseudomonadaceae bacterium]|nr:hypothetical protein [Pseudomonadaceae bacterium]
MSEAATRIPTSIEITADQFKTKKAHRQLSNVRTMDSVRRMDSVRSIAIRHNPHNRTINPAPIRKTAMSEAAMRIPTSVGLTAHKTHTPDSIKARKRAFMQIKT